MGHTILCTKAVGARKTKSIDLLHDKSTSVQKTVTLHFLSPSVDWGEGIRATYDVHLRLIGKPVVDFLLVITDLFG